MRIKSLPFSLGLALVPFAAWAGGSDALAAATNALAASAVFANVQNAEVASQPKSPAAKPVQPIDETKLALQVLVAKAENRDGSMVGETARRFGFHVEGTTVPVKSVSKQADNDTIRFFFVHKTSESAKITLHNYVKKEYLEYSFLMSTEGVLVMAATTQKNKDGSFTAKKIEIDDEVRKKFAKELEFWLKYYRDNLKGKDGADKVVSSSPGTEKK